MYTLHCTKKLLDRIKRPVVALPPTPTTALGNWYATALFWKPQVTLLVNEQTLLPVLMPLAPASDLATRFPIHLATVLRALGVDDQFISQEVGAMTEFVTAKTSDRSVPVTMNVFSFLAKTYRDMMETSDLLALALRLADTPCSPIKYNSPARVMQDLVAGGFA